MREGMSPEWTQEKLVSQWAFLRAGVSAEEVPSSKQNADCPEVWGKWRLGDDHLLDPSDG